MQKRGKNKMKDIINNFLVKCGKNVPQEVFNEVAYLRHKAEMYDELAYNGHQEIGNENILIYCDAFISAYDCELNWGVSVYKWDGTYNERPLSLTSKKTFKFKNWVEIYHDHRTKKPDMKKLLEQFSGDYLEKLKEITKEVSNKQCKHI